MNYLEERASTLERQRSRTTFSHMSSAVIVKCGYLWKTSYHPGRTSSKTRYFVLTKSSLDHFRNHHREKLKGSLPLAAIDSVEKLREDYNSLKITGPFKHPLVLQASGKEECQDWIKAIENGIQQWRLDSDASSPSLHKKDEVDSLQSCLNAIPMKMKMLYPSLFCPARDGVLFSASSELHHEYPMIKYARGGRSIPHERVFKLDNDNLHIMWKKRGRAHSFTFTNTLCLDRVVEVRCGQQTKNFVKFPYTEVESQSFSLMFEKQQGEWSQLCSLDLICDSPKAFEKWSCAMREVIYGKDLRVNRHKFDGVDPVVLWLKRHWSVMSSRHSKGISVDQALSFAQHCCSGAKRKLLRNYVKDVLETQCGIVQHNENLLWNSFVMLFNSINEQPRLYEIFCKYAKEHPNLGMTPTEFAEFLNREQEESLSLPACARLMSIHDKFHMMYKQKCAGDNPESFRLSKSFLSYHGFLSYLRSKDNSAVKPEHDTVYQEMDHPLTDYFINSSHNTYLTGRQLKGHSSLEAYVRALLQGCRCVELDCWDGPDEPVITHGLTLTSKIRFRDVVQVIREYAFEASEFPLILSLENHCNEQQQAIMADIFITELGDMLATNNLSDELGIQTLPSPNDLKRKIFLKGKIKVKKKHKISTAIWPGMSTNPIISGFSPRVKKTSTSSRVLVSSQSEAMLARSESSQSLGTRVRSVTTTTMDEKGSTSEEPYSVVPLEHAMGKLIVYCRAVTYKKNEVSDDCCEMYSFNDGTAQDFISGHPRDILSLANKHIVRTYPKGSRVDSSNYNPQTMWNAGIQMVAINYQKPDSGMHLNQGKFTKNGGCGYILKPQSLRNREKSNYHPMIKESPKNGKSCYFTIEVLSGQNLHVSENSQFPIRVDVETVGVQEDCALLSTEPTLDKLNPQFENVKQLFKIIMPELCLVYFKVHLLNRNKSRLLFQNVISLDSLRPGVHYIRLRSPTGVEIAHSGLFVRIKLQDFEQSPNKVKGASRERTFTF